jgi:hypothetical protein
MYFSFSTRRILYDTLLLILSFSLYSTQFIKQGPENCNILLPHPVRATLAMLNNVKMKLEFENGCLATETWITAKLWWFPTFRTQTSLELLPVCAEPHMRTSCTLQKHGEGRVRRGSYGHNFHVSKFQLTNATWTVHSAGEHNSRLLFDE